MALPSEIKRKLFHHLSVVYLLVYILLPRWASLWLFFVVLLVLGAVEFIRIRRPEVNAWFLGHFAGVHRTSEILRPSGIFWTLLGSWLTMLIFVSKPVVIVALGYLAFGDTMAAVCGQRFGTKHWSDKWKGNPEKTIAGSIAFAATAILWSVLFLRIFPAVLSGLVTAFIESRRLSLNDNLWVPLLAAVSIGLIYGASRARIPALPILLAETVGFTLFVLGSSYFVSKRKADAA
jgi:dolichol kinase